MFIVTGNRRSQVWNANDKEEGSWNGWKLRAAGPQGNHPSKIWSTQVSASKRWLSTCLLLFNWLLITRDLYCLFSYKKDKMTCWNILCQTRKSARCTGAPRWAKCALWYLLESEIWHELYFLHITSPLILLAEVHDLYSICCSYLEVEISPMSKVNELVCFGAAMLLKMNCSAIPNGIPLALVRN